MYRSVAAAFEEAVGVGFDVHRAYRLKDGGVPHDDPALVTALLVYRWGGRRRQLRRSGRTCQN